MVGYSDSQVTPLTSETPVTPVVPRDATRSSFIEVSTTVRMLDGSPDTATTLDLDAREGSRTDPVSEAEVAVGRRVDSVCGPADELGFDRPLFAPDDTRESSMPETASSLPETASSLPPPAVDDFAAPSMPRPLPPLPALDGDDQVDEDDVDTSVYTGRVAEPPTIGLAQQALDSSQTRSIGSPSPLRRPTGPGSLPGPRRTRDERLVFPRSGSAATPTTQPAAQGPRQASSLSIGDTRGLYVSRPRSREVVVAGPEEPSAIQLPIFTPGTVEEPPPEALLPIAAPVPRRRPRWLFWLLGSVLLGLAVGVAAGLSIKSLCDDTPDPAPSTSAPATPGASAPERTRR